MDIEICKNCSSYKYGKCYALRFHPSSLDDMPYCPYLTFPSGKYKHMNVKVVINIDPEYVVKSTFDKSRIIPKKYKVAWRNQIHLMINNAIKHTQKQLDTLCDCQEKLNG